LAKQESEHIGKQKEMGKRGDKYRLRLKERELAFMDKEKEWIGALEK
jgi:hypothetical protein